MRLSFGELTLDTDARQLLHGSEQVPLSPKAFELLMHLVQNRPRALSKTELHDLLWPGTFVSDTNLAGLVVEVRRALRDDARSPRFLRTVQRFGYAFAGTVGSANAASKPGGPARFWLIAGRRQIPLFDGENVLGRDAESGGFESTTVSRRHARIMIDGEDAYLEDLGSKNGTFVRGKRITSKRLSDGDRIELGSAALTFRVAGDDQSTRTWRKPI
jgi:DNA-binding winged helix-turn-helix (wHTH) protein